MKAWMDTMTDNVMMEGVKAKFGQNKKLCDYLINTKDKVLVEANARDAHWSCGLPTKEDENTLLDNTKWLGKNRLGEILMTVRDTFAV